MTSSTSMRRPVRGKFVLTGLVVAFSLFSAMINPITLLICPQVNLIFT